MTTGTVSPLAERAGLALPHTEVWPDCATLGATLKSATTFCRFVVLSMSSLKLSNSQTFHLSSGGYLNNKRQNSRNKMAGPSASSSSVSSTVSIGSFIQQLKPKVFTLEFLWYVSHLFTIFNVVLYQFFSFFSARLSLNYYNRALLSIIFTYFIVLFQVFKSSKLSFFNPRNLLQNDNFQHLSLSIVWYLFSNKWVISGGLLPFLIYSVFHSLNYFKNHILPILPSISHQAKNQFSAAISNLIVRFNEQSLVAASNLEIMVLGQQLIGVIFALLKVFTFDFGTILTKGLITLQYIAFLKLRYKQSKHTKLLIDGYLYKVDMVFASGRLPANLTAQYHVLKERVKSLLAFLPN